MFKYLLIHSNEFVKEFKSYEEMIEDFLTYKNPQFCKVLDYNGYSGKDITNDLLVEHHLVEGDQK